MSKLLIVITILCTGCAIYPTHRSIAIKYCEQASHDTVCPGYDRGAHEGYNNVDYIRENVDNYRRPW